MARPGFDQHSAVTDDGVPRETISRRDFMGRAALLGLGLPAAALALGARSSAAGYRRGGVLRLATSPPSGAPEPLTMNDEGSILTCQIAGEYLAVPRPDYVLVPRLAVGWRMLDPLTWTFDLRPGVRFHDGRPMTADDVVATFNRLADPSVGNAALAGILPRGQTSRVDAYTVNFHLAQAYVDFPYLVSAFNHNAIILPANYEPGTFSEGVHGTGPFRISSYRSDTGVDYARNADYWQHPKPYLDGVTMVYEADGPSRLRSLERNRIDVLTAPAAPGLSAAMGLGAGVVELRSRSTRYRSIHLRVDQSPFDDVNVRQALALSIDRPALVAQMVAGAGGLGNDHAFAPVLPVAAQVGTIPQRQRDVGAARALLARSGHRRIQVELVTESYQELPRLARAVAAQAAQAGFDISVSVDSQSAYFDDAGKTQPWLTVPFGITDWQERGTIAQVVTNTYTSNGIWNSSHWSDQEFDSLISQIGATTDGAQRTALALAAARRQHDQVPAIIAYWLDDVRLASTRVRGLAAGPSAWFDAAALSLR